MARKISQLEYQAKQRDADGFEYECPDGHTFAIDPPLLWSKQQKAALRRAKALERQAQEAGVDTDEGETLQTEALHAMVEGMLGGKGRLDAFTAAGGDPQTLLVAFRGSEGSDPGES